MTVTQYIGARYVPLFNDPLDWDINKEYEPLTIVYYGGNSYTSKQSVPKNIDITNTSYWALTGNYNAQIEQYRKEVVAHDARITAAEKTAENAKTAADTAADSASEAKTQADNALSLAQTNEKDIATLDSEVAGTSDSGLKSLINAETERSIKAEENLSDDISTVDAKFPVATDYIADSAVTNVKLADASVSVDKLDSTVTDLIAKQSTYKNMIFIGDSWGRGYYSGSEHVDDGIAVKIANLLGCNLTNASVSGSGWATGTNFYSQYNSLSTEIKSNADIIVIAGGQNDKGDYIAPTVASNNEKLLVAMANYSPNAQVFIFNMPFSTGKTFGTDGDNTNSLYDTYSIIARRSQAYALSNNKSITIFNGCPRWGLSINAFNGSAIDDQWHLNALGYGYWANMAVNAILSRKDYWPNLRGECSNLPSNISWKYTSVFEVNGTITLYLVGQATQDVSSFTFYLPEFCLGNHTYYLTGVCPTSTGTFVAFDQDFNNKRVAVSVQGSTIPNTGWIFISHSWVAGL